MAYLIAAGHDIALEDLDPLVGGASTIGLQYTRRSFAASGTILDELPFVEFLFSTISVARYQAILTQVGLLTANTAPVSVYLQDENYEWILRNGEAVKPLLGTDGSRTNYLLRDFVLLIRSLRAQA